VLLQAGRVAAAGPVDEVVAAGPVGAVYGVELVEGGGLGWRLPDGNSLPGGSP
jgi:ABC-type hemin transport system ATPase subunit